MPGNGCHLISSLHSAEKKFLLPHFMDKRNEASENERLAQVAQLVNDCGVESQITLDN